MKYLKRINVNHELYEHDGMLYQIKETVGGFIGINQLSEQSREYKNKGWLLKIIINKQIKFYAKSDRLKTNVSAHLKQSLRRQHIDSLAKMIKYDKPIPRTQAEIGRMLRYIKKSCIFFRQIKEMDV